MTSDYKTRLFRLQIQRSAGINWFLTLFPSCLAGLDHISISLYPWGFLSAIDNEWFLVPLLGNWSAIRSLVRRRNHWPIRVWRFLDTANTENTRSHYKGETITTRSPLPHGAHYQGDPLPQETHYHRQTNTRSALWAILATNHNADKRFD